MYFTVEQDLSASSSTVLGSVVNYSGRTEDESCLRDNCIRLHHGCLVIFYQCVILVCCSLMTCSPPSPVASWFISPLLSGLMSGLLFMLIRHFILSRVGSHYYTQISTICSHLIIFLFVLLAQRHFLTI